MMGLSIVVSPRRPSRYWPNMQVIRYNNGTDALVVWEDWREPGPPYQGSDLRYYNVDGFAP